MKEINLDIISRDKTGKSNCKQLRNMGKVPAVIYGDKKEPAYIAIDYPKIIKELSKPSVGTSLTPIACIILLVFTLKLVPKKKSTFN